MSQRHLRAAMIFAAVGCSLSLVDAARAQSTGGLRVVAWNLTLYNGGRVPDFQNSFYAIVPNGLPLAGRSMSPDIIVANEVLSAAAVTAMVNTLNTAPGSPGDWAGSNFIDGPDTDCALFYRTSKVQFIGTTVVSLVTGSTALPPRNTYRYDVRLVGYADQPATRLAMYATHMKSSDTTTDQQRRLLEANKIRDNANGLNTNGVGTALPPGTPFLVGGDFNIQSSTQAAYQRLIGDEPNNTGRFFDPIFTPGNWNNSNAFRFVHTQDPSTSGAGGMDDRHDQILIGGSLRDGIGFDYVGNSAIPYSTTTWNDPNHSYRSWGNDGTTFNGSLAVASNSMVGPVIAQALINVANAGGGSGGHLPVFLDLDVPAKIASDSTIDFGQVALNSVATQNLTITNTGDVARWSINGIAPLRYTLAASSGFGAPAGPLVELAGGAGNSHIITMDTSTAGIKTGTITITSDAPEQPVRVVTITGEVLGSCPADFNGDNTSDFFDYLDFVTAWDAELPAADFNNDNTIDFFDYLDFVTAWDLGCP